MYFALANGFFVVGGVGITHGAVIEGLVGFTGALIFLLASRGRRRGEPED